MPQDQIADQPGPSALPRVQKLTPSDLRTALVSGFADFRRAPAFGLVFSAIYVLAGLALVTMRADAFVWTLVLSLGFPLIAPFLAVGLYEVSRRIEAGSDFAFPDIFGVIWRERTRQVPWAGAVIVIYFLFWTFLAHMLFAVFMGPSALMAPPDSLSTYLSGPGLAMIATELIVGGVLAFLLFSITVVSLPLLLDLEVDFVTAMMLSFRTTRANLWVMVLWAALIAVTTFLALIPWFLGLLVVLPVLGHASWHLYRAALQAEAD